MMAKGTRLGRGLLLQRVMAKCAVDDGCLLWTGAIWGRGRAVYEKSPNCPRYPQISYKGKLTRGDRVVWMLVNGEIPVGKCVLHTCHTLQIWSLVFAEQHKAGQAARKRQKDLHCL